MRKCKIIVTPDKLTFQPMVTIMMLENGVRSELISNVYLSTNERYTAAQLANISLCNKALAEKGMEPLTEEESDFLVDKNREGTLPPSIDELQRLSGFKVEKIITYLDEGIEP